MADHKDKVRITALRISFLMKHQEILPDLKELVEELNLKYADSNGPICSAAYLEGAHDALFNLISALEQKGI